jgi:drug/metabolite transporter (DMT)-like permease
MLPSVFATFLFSASVLFASRSARLLGSMQANVSRLVLAMVLLGIWAHGFGGGWRGPALPWFLLSGIIGFGLGDMALFGALPRIGPRLAILLTQCLGAPIAGLAEYLLLGTRISGLEAAFGVLILAGVALALAPDTKQEVDRSTFRVGVLFGIGSAMGQGLGAVFSRMANAVALQHGVAVDGGTAAYQRITAGVVLTLLFWLVLRRTGHIKEAFQPLPKWKEASWLVVGNAFRGRVWEWPPFSGRCAPLPVRLSCRLLRPLRWLPWRLPGGQKAHGPRGVPLLGAFWPWRGLPVWRGPDTERMLPGCLAREKPGKPEAGWENKKARQPEGVWLSTKTGVPSWEPAGELLLEALDALGSSRMGLMLVVLGAGAETKCNRHQSHKSNFLHNMVFLSLFRQTGEPRFSRG